MSQHRAGHERVVTASLHTYTSDQQPSPKEPLRLTLADAITPDMTIASITERWPDTARIFARYGLGCASCAISKSETVLQGATGHGGGRVNVDDLLRDLNTFASTGKLPNGLPEASAVA